MDVKQVAPSVTLESVIATHQLVRRPVREVDFREENAAFKEIALVLGSEPDSFLDRLVEIALGLCDADSVAISMEEPGPGGHPVLRRIAAAGALRHLVNSTAPRDFSPCGMCLDTNQPLLMNGLHRLYPYFKLEDRPFEEALFLPWRVKDGPVGTLWVVAHNQRRKFDLHDVRVMSSLAAFVSVGVYFTQVFRKAEHVATSSRITAEMAHQINNPLQAALGAIFVIRTQGNLDQNSLEMLAILQTEIDRVVALSTELLRHSASGA